MSAPLYDSYVVADLELFQTDRALGVLFQQTGQEERRIVQQLVHIVQVTLLQSLALSLSLLLEMVLLQRVLP